MARLVTPAVSAISTRRDRPRQRSVIGPRRRSWRPRRGRGPQGREQGRPRGVAGPAADEFHHSDLIGLTVFQNDGRQLGRAIAVHNHGAGDLLEAPAGRRSVLLPFHATAVPAVDLTAGVITVDPPLGLLPGDPETA